MNKTEKLREKTEDELAHRKQELDEQLFKLRFQRATGALENPMKMRDVRREVARINTILRERELASQAESVEKV